jgi:hypothetical protein
LHARAPIGLFAFVLLGLSAIAHLWAVRTRGGNIWRPLSVGALTAIGFLSLNVLAYLKFKTFNAAPLHYNVQYSPERLARIDGKAFHLVNLPHNVNDYFTAAAFKIGARFPFVIFDLERRRFPNAKIDLEEPVVSIPHAMTGLVMLALAAGIGAFTVAGLRRPLALIALSVLPLLGCMLTFIATTHRYTADFCPPLVAAAGFGLAYLDGVALRWRRLGLACAALATVYASVITLALSFHFQVDLVWGSPEEVRLNFFDLRDRTDAWFGISPNKS